MRRVLVLNHFAKPPDQPGGNRHVDLFSRLNGWDPRIMAADRNNMSDARQRPSAGSPIVYVPTVGGRSAAARTLGWVTYALGAFVRGVRGQRPHVVYGSSPHLFAALAGLLLARWWRVPFVLEIRDIWPRILTEMGGMSESDALYRLLRGLERYLYEHADHIVYLASGNRDYLLSEGVEDDRMTFIPNSVAPTTPSIDRDEARARLGVDGFVAVYTGAHGKANGLHLVLDAVEELGQSGLDITILLVGDGPEKAALKQTARERGLVNVRFLDPVPKRELPDILVAADLGVHVLADVQLFRHGVSPNKVMDYMAAGLPVLTNSPGEVGDLVQDANSGVSCEPRELARGLATLIDLGAADRRKLGQSGLRFVQEQRNPDLMAARLSRVLVDPDGAG